MAIVVCALGRPELGGFDYEVGGASGQRLSPERQTIDSGQLTTDGFLFDLFVFVDDAVADGDDAVGAGGDVGFVRDDDDGVAFGVEFLEEVHDLDARL